MVLCLLVLVGVGVGIGVWVVGVDCEGREAEDSAELCLICCRWIACEDGWHATA